MLLETQHKLLCRTCTTAKVAVRFAVHLVQTVFANIVQNGEGEVAHCAAAHREHASLEERTRTIPCEAVAILARALTFMPLMPVSLQLGLVVLIPMVLPTVTCDM